MEKLDKSISEGNGGCNEDSANYRPYSTAKPSINWKVFNKADNIKDEMLEIWLKVGIEKVVLSTDKFTGDPVPTMRLDPMDIIEMLVNLRQMVEGLPRETGKGFLRTCS